MNETVKIFKLTKAPYDEMNNVKVSVTYIKDGYNAESGYYAVAELVNVKDGFVSKCFSKTYYQHDGDLTSLVVSAKRQSAKNKENAMNIVKEKSKVIAEYFINHVNSKLGTDVEIVA